MATRAIQDLTKAVIKEYGVEPAQTSTVGKFQKFGTTDETLQDAGAGDLPMGCCISKDPISSRLTVAMSNAICKVVVGTGGATRGKFGVVVADGVTDKTLGGGTTVQYVVCQFLQTGVVGDLVGARLLDVPSVSA